MPFVTWLCGAIVTFKWSQAANVAIVFLGEVAASELGKVMTTPVLLAQLCPMSEFDASQPAILHDRSTDNIETWTGEDAADYSENSIARPDGTIEWRGFVFDGWDDVLGG